MMKTMHLQSGFVTHIQSRDIILEMMKMKIEEEIAKDLVAFCVGSLRGRTVVAETKLQLQMIGEIETGTGGTPHMAEEGMVVSLPLGEITPCMSKEP
jgi:hypothetical protein